MSLEAECSIYKNCLRPFPLSIEFHIMVLDKRVLMYKAYFAVEQYQLFHGIPPISFLAVFGEKNNRDLCYFWGNGIIMLNVIRP